MKEGFYQMCEEIGKIRRLLGIPQKTFAEFANMPVGWLAAIEACEWPFGQAACAEVGRIHQTLTHLREACELKHCLPPLNTAAAIRLLLAVYMAGELPGQANYRTPMQVSR